MSRQIEFFFDYKSPYAYLAHTQLHTLGAEIVPRPIAVLEVMKVVDNTPTTILSKAKGAYARADLARWVQRYGIAMQFNPGYREVDGTLLLRGAVAALRAGVFGAYDTAIVNALWRDGRDLLTAEGREAVLRDASLGDADIWARAATVEIAAALDAANQAAAARGIFGTPSFIVDGELFFGNDRLDFVRARLGQAAA
jgi:2-hydroxychromene-2-carboxylate isomerase